MEEEHHRHISGYMRKKEVIVSGYHEFNKPKSCLNELITFSDEMTRFEDKERVVGTIYLDFSKACDIYFPQYFLQAGRQDT